MTREEAKVLLPIIQAFAEGKKIIVKDKRLSDEEYNWSEVDDCSFNIKQFDYHIKPEPTYRPFKDAEECWKEMQKHQPFGWIADEDCYRSIAILDDESIEVPSFVDDDFVLSFKEAMDGYTFADGTPFGVKE